MALNVSELIFTFLFDISEASSPMFMKFYVAVKMISCCYIYIWTRIHNLYERRVVLNLGLGGTRDVASAIISREQTQ